VFRCRRELLGAALGAALWSSSVGAEPMPRARVYLDYARDDGARSCVSSSELARSVEARLGRSVFVDAAQADLIAEVRARRVEGAFVIDIDLFDRGHAALGERQLSTRAPHCSSLDDSLALVLSLAADAPPPAPVGRALAPGPAAAAPQPPEREPSFVPTPIAIPATTHAPRRGIALEPSLGAALLFGPVPGVTAGLELGVVVRSGSFWPVSLNAAGWWPRTHSAANERGARFSAKSLELGVCPWEGPLGPIVLRTCVREWFGRVSARGFGFDEDQRSDRWVLAFGIGATLTHWFGPVLLSVDGVLLVPPVRRRYFFADGAASTTLHEEPWLFGSVGIRLGTEF
jgi:hypothetical protein